MKRQDHEPASSGPEKPRKPSRTEEAQRIVEEYANSLREILRSFARSLIDPTSGLGVRLRRILGKAARSSDLRVSPTLLVRADEVIE